MTTELGRKIMEQATKYGWSAQYQMRRGIPYYHLAFGDRILEARLTYREDRVRYVSTSRAQSRTAQIHDGGQRTLFRLIKSQGAGW